MENAAKPIAEKWAQKEKVEIGGFVVTGSVLEVRNELSHDLKIVRSSIFNFINKCVVGLINLINLLGRGGGKISGHVPSGPQEQEEQKQGWKGSQASWRISGVLIACLYVHFSTLAFFLIASFRLRMTHVTLSICRQETWLEILESA